MNPHVRGLLRSAELKAYLAGEPQWEVLLDLDQLAEAEGENWVYKGAECLEPDASRCLLRLSRGGSDAVTLREFDLGAKRFVTDGFVSSEAKQSVAWLDADRLLIAKAGDGFRATDSGYGAELRLWRRGEPLQASQLLLDVPADHVAVSGAVLNNALGTFRLPSMRRPSSKRTCTTLGNALNGAASPQKLPLPPDVDWRGLFQDRLIGLTRSEWLPATGTASVPAEVPVGEPTGTPIPAGTLFSVPLSDLLAGQLANVEALVRPTARRAVTGVRAGRSSLYVSVTEDVVMQLLELSPQETGWSRRAVQLPANGSLSIVSATPHSDLGTGEFRSLPEA